MRVWFRNNWLMTLAILLASGGSPWAPSSAAAGKRLSPAPGHNPRQQTPQADKTDLTIAVAVNLVTIDVSVMGNQRRDLRAEDFVVYDNGTAQQLTHFSHDQLPLSIALVVDLSGSIRPYIGELRDKARSALSALKPEDQVVLFGFTTFAAQFTELTSSSSRIAETLGGVRVGGSTNICDGIFIAARYLRENARGRRKAIILISDNCHNITWGQTWESVRRELLENGVTLWGIQIRGRCSIRERDRAREIAEDTGGGILEVGGILDFFTGRSLTRLLNQAIANLRSQYTLGFTPSDAKQDGSFHRLRVALSDGAPCSKCPLSARSGYYAGGPLSSPPVALNRTIGISQVRRVDADVYNRITIAAADMAESREIPFDFSFNSEEDAAGRLRMKINLQIDVSGIEFRTVEDRHSAKLFVGLFFGWPNGPYSDVHWKIVDLHLKEETYRETLSKGVPVSFLVPAVARGALIKAVICHERGKSVGSKRFVIQ